MIGDLNHGMQRWIDWNLIVDQNGGPRHVDGGFAAPLFLNASGEVVQTVAYAYLNLIMNAIPAGSVRIGCSAFAPSVEVTAVRTPQNRIGILLYHPAKEKELVHIRIAGQVISVTLPAESLTEVAIST
jgi:glucosylceramidase